MLQALRQTSRRVLVLVVLAALLSLLHTINHDALIGSHHEDGDLAGSTIELIVTTAMALLGTVAIIGGTVLDKPECMEPARSSRSHQPPWTRSGSIRPHGPGRPSLSSP